MNWAALPRWAFCVLLFALFVALPSLSYLLDGPNESDTAQRVVDDKADAVTDARRVARIGE